MTFSSLRIEPLLQLAEDRLQAKHDVREVTKVGTLRGGNSGILTTEGEVFGKCHRLSLSRYLGVSKPTDRVSHLFFAAGHANEDNWKKLFAEVFTDLGGVLLAEGEVPTAWTVDHLGSAGDSVPVTGSPDFVQCTPHEDYVPPAYDDHGKLTAPARNFTANLVFELKKVCSTYRATQVFVMMQPGSDHLIQLAHYTWQHGKVPGLLSYTSDSNYDTPYWAIKKYGCARRIPPGRQHYYTAWHGDQFCFIHPVSGEVVPTKITSAGIENYYKLVVAMNDQQDLGPRPSKAEVYGDGKAYDVCKTCPFSAACSTYDATRDYQGWIDEISTGDFDASESAD